MSAVSHVLFPRCSCATPVVYFQRTFWGFFLDLLTSSERLWFAMAEPISTKWLAIYLSPPVLDTWSQEWMKSLGSKHRMPFVPFATIFIIENIHCWAKLKPVPLFLEHESKRRDKHPKSPRNVIPWQPWSTVQKQWTGLWEQVPLSPASHMADDGRHSHHDYTLSVPIPWCSIWYSGSNDPVVLTVFPWVLLSLEQREM